MRVYADGERREHVVIRNVSLGKYAEKVVLENKCDALLEMRVVYDGDNTNIFYLTDGLETVGFLMRRAPEFSFYRCVTEMLRAVSKTAEYLVMEEELVFDPEFMFVDPESGKIRMMYVPGANDHISLREGIIDLADLWIAGGTLSERELESIIAYKKDIFYKDYGMRELSRITEDASRSLYYTESDDIADMESEDSEYQEQRDNVDDGTELFYSAERKKSRDSIGHKIMDFINELVS